MNLILITSDIVKCLTYIIYWYMRISNRGKLRYRLKSISMTS